MRKVKKFALFMSIILLWTTIIGSVSASAAFTPKFELNSQAVYMVNTDTDIVVVSKNADKKMFPASLTKIMTCLVALENIKDFSSYVLCPYTSFNEFNEDNPNYWGPSTAVIEPKQTNITYMHLLYGLMLPSGCECANILAYNLGGESIPNFIKMMNDKAKEIGCKNTNFSNAHGLFDPNNYTTAYDMYLITKYAMDNYPRFMEICDTYSYEMPANEYNPDGYYITHTNPMMKTTSDYYYEGVHGIKTGSIDKFYYVQENGLYDTSVYEYGVRCLVTTAERDGFHYIIVSMGAPYCNEDGSPTETQLSVTDHINLYDWAFAEFEYTKVLEKNEQIAQVAVDKGKDADTVGIIVTEEYYTLLPKSLDRSTIQRILEPVVSGEDTDGNGKVELKELLLEAPVEKSMPIANLKLKLNGEVLANIPLITEQRIELDMTEYYKEKIHNIISTTQFKLLVGALIILIILFIFTRAIRKSHEKRVSEMNRRRKISMAPPKKKRSNFRR